jgi:hypothetical protein
MTQPFIPPSAGYTTYGIDNNFYQALTISATTWGGGSTSGVLPDIIIPFTPAGVIFTNLSASGTVLYTFNGTTQHGQLIGYSGLGISQQLTFYNRVISKIWFKVASGSVNISVEAWPGY